MTSSWSSAGSWERRYPLGRIMVGNSNGDETKVSASWPIRATRGSPGGQHTILYDGACGLCRRAVDWACARDKHSMFTAIPYQEAPSPPMTPALVTACHRAVHVVQADGRILKSGRAVLFILERTGMGAPARLLACPPFLWLVELAYRLVAGNRSFFGRFLFRGPSGKP